MAHSKRELPTGRAHTKVSGDDEMLRTGFHDGTPLEGGKIADSRPVDLFAAAHRVAEASPDSQQQQQGTTNNNPAAKTEEQQQQGQDAAGGGAAGGRRLGVGRPAY